MKDLKPTLIAEYISGSDSVKFYSDFTCHCFFDGEIDIVEQSQDFFDFVEIAVSCYSSYNVVDNWHELNECFGLFVDMTDNQKVLFAHVLCDYSYSYDLPTLTNYVLENACLFEGTASDYAYELVEDCYDTKSMGNLVNYLDYDAFARDLICGGDIIELGYNLFWTNPHEIFGYKLFLG